MTKVAFDFKLNKFLSVFYENKHKLELFLEKNPMDPSHFFRPTSKLNIKNERALSTFVHLVPSTTRRSSHVLELTLINDYINK